MSTLSGCVVADNVASVSRLLHTAHRAVHAHDRERILREARVIVDHARHYYENQAEQIVLELTQLVRVLIAPARAALDVVDAELTALERGHR
jgi:hypothetical protein